MKTSMFDRTLSPLGYTRSIANSHTQSYRHGMSSCDDRQSGQTIPFDIGGNGHPDRLSIRYNFLFVFFQCSLAALLSSSTSSSSSSVRFTILTPPPPHTRLLVVPLSGYRFQATVAQRLFCFSPVSHVSVLIAFQPSFFKLTSYMLQTKIAHIDGTLMEKKEKDVWSL